MTSKISTSLLALLALLLVGATNGTAAPGDLDTTFGNGGIVVTSGFVPNLEIAGGMAIQSDGKIVVVGEGSNGSFNWDFAVARYNTDGSLDSSFGGTGIVITQLTGNYDGASAVAIQADGKIVVAGSRYNCFCIDSSFAVVRYNPNGSLDTSFNGMGIVITSVGSSRDYANSLAIQTDGKIVVAGISGNNNFALVRYNPNGSLDTSFNGTGKVITPGGEASSVAIQADGKIIAAGGSELVRFNTDGTLDSSFNGTGRVLLSIGVNSAAIQADGRIVAAGYDNSSNTNFAVVRYNPNGSLDTSFGGTGKIVIPFGDSNSEASSVAIQSDGKVVAVGSSGNGNTGTDFAVARLNPNGSLDTTFDGTGKVITPIVNQDFISFASAVVIQADGKIVVAGSTDSGYYDFYDFVVVRYQGGGAACPNPIDCADFFVRQHYSDFLSRDPDAGGLAYWTNEITQCGTNAACLHQRRIGVSTAFFIETEFQETGYFVYRLYRASYGTMPAPNQTRANLTYAEFNQDRANLIGGPDLEQAKQNLVNNWTQRSRFLTEYPLTLSNAEFVTRLFDRAGLVPFTAEREAEINAMNTQGRTRAQVLRNVLEQPVLVSREYNPAFVLTQYFGYLRRDPDQAGYDFWLNAVVNGQPNNYRGMVCAFLTAAEYQLRFSNVVTRSNADCAP